MATVYTVLRLVYHLPRNLLIGGIRLYQMTLSPWLGGECRFAPTCSQYAVQALRQYGAVKGFILLSWRILRCNPYGSYGYDPPRWFGEPKPENDIELPDVCCASPPTRSPADTPPSS